MVSPRVGIVLVEFRAEASDDSWEKLWPWGVSLVWEMNRVEAMSVGKYSVRRHREMVVNVSVLDRNHDWGLSLYNLKWQIVQDIFTSEPVTGTRIKQWTVGRSRIDIRG